MREGFDISELGKTLRNDVFATWFGWSIIVSVIIFPMTSMISTCHGNSVKEDIEIAKIQAKNPDRADHQSETLKWLVTRGVHPLVARCAILNSPSTQCASMMNALEDEDRSIIKELILNPAALTVVGKATGVVIPRTVPINPEVYVQGLDFGSASPTK